MPEQEQNDFSALLADDYEYPDPTKSQDPVFEETEEKEPNKNTPWWEQEDEDDREQYGRKVQKRIDRITARHHAEINAEKLKVQSLEQRLQALESGRQKENQQQVVSDLKDKHQTLLEQKKNALDTGDHDTVIALDEQLLDLRDQMNAHSKIQQRQERQPQPQPQPQPQEQLKQPLENQKPAALADWEDENQWVFDPKQSAKKEKTNEILRKLYEEGFKPESHSTFDELDRRLKRVLPPAPLPVDRGNFKEETRQSEGRLNPSEKNAMLGFGLDPDDPKDRMAWIAQRSRK